MFGSSIRRGGLWVVATALLAVVARAEEARDVRIVDASGQAVASYAASHALVIGVSDYTAGWKDLPSIPAEMAQVARALEGQGFGVERVLNPDEDHLRSAIDTFVDNYGYTPENRLLIFFAGHGYSRRVNGTQRGYLVPADAPVPTEKADRRFLTKAVPMLDVVAWARKIEARHVLFVFDSCFSGAVLDARSLPPEPAHIDTLTGRPVRQFLTAGSAGQTVPAKSVFAPAFVNALAGVGDLSGDGYVTGTELWLYLHQLISQTGQTPQHGRLLGYHEGDFVFRVPIPVPPEIPTFDVADLEARSDVELGWANYQRQMQTAHAKVERVESLGGTAVTKAAAWQRFLETFDRDNPLSTADEKLRQQAEVRLAHWRSQSQAPAPPARQAREAGDAMVEAVLGMRFRYIPPGTFQMGSPATEEGRDSDESQHQVTLSRGFWMGETEVTQKQWRALMGSDPSYFSECGDNCPVEQVNWYEAVSFANELSDRAGLEPCYEVKGGNGKRAGEDLEYESIQFQGLECKGYRLPTEAEWEYAARAGTTTALYTGPLTLRGQRNGPELDTIAWYGGNSGVAYGGGLDCSGWAEKQDASSTHCGTHPVAQKQANRWGLHDMLGNVYEWSWDWFGTYPTSAQQDPLGPESGSFRVLRGCGWVSGARSCRSANRFRRAPGGRSFNAGFRLVRLP